MLDVDEVLSTGSSSPSKKLEASRRIQIKAASDIMLVISQKKKDLDEHVKFVAKSLGWTVKAMKKIAKMRYDQNFGAFKAEFEFIIDEYESLFGKQAIYDDSSDEVEPDDLSISSAELKHNRRNEIDYVCELLEEIEQKKDELKKLISDKAERLEWDESKFKKIATLYHNQNFPAFVHENESMSEDYQELYGGIKYN